LDYFRPGAHPARHDPIQKFGDILNERLEVNAAIESKIVDDRKAEALTRKV
jgi:hypothetical protein